MFYCDTCAKRNRWPISALRWNSVCEMCGYQSECSDIPSRALPDPSYVDEKVDPISKGFA